MLSRRTLTRLSQSLANLTHAELSELFFEYGIDNDKPRGTRRDRAIHLVRTIQQAHSSDEAERAYLDILSKHLRGRPPGYAASLIKSLELDGYTWNGAKVVPTTPAPASLGVEISALERNLDAAGFDVAAQHYGQAVGAFARGAWEGANGQVRSFVEDLFISLGNELTGNRRRDPKAALQDLRDGGHLDTEEWNLLRYYWDSIQTNGPHHGLSDHDEALFRLHVATAIGQYLLSKA